MYQVMQKFVQHLINQKSFPIQAEITKVYTRAEQYYVDCQELDPLNQKVNTYYTHVPLPKYWGTKQGGVWMTPSQGAIALLCFLNGDKNFPIITNVMEHGYTMPHDENTFTIAIDDCSFTMSQNEIACKNGNVECSLNKHISIKNNTTSLGQILDEIVDLINGLTITCPQGGLLKPTFLTLPSHIKAKINNLFK